MSFFLNKIAYNALSDGAKYLKRDYQELQYIPTLEKKKDYAQRSLDKSYQTISDKLKINNSACGFIKRNKIIDETQNGKYWVIDSVDCMPNFISSIPLWGMLLLLKNEEKIEAVFYYLPVLEELFSFKLDEGGFVNKIKLSLKTKQMDFLKAGVNSKMGSDYFHLFFCAANRFSLAVIKNEPQISDVANFVMKEISGYVHVKEDKIIVGSEFSVKNFL